MDRRHEFVCLLACLHDCFMLPIQMNVYVSECVCACDKFDHYTPIKWKNSVKPMYIIVSSTETVIGQKSGNFARDDGKFCSLPNILFHTVVIECIHTNMQQKVSIYVIYMGDHVELTSKRDRSSCPTVSNDAAR